jgi:hypothetical protein
LPASSDAGNVLFSCGLKLGADQDRGRRDHCVSRKEVQVPKDTKKMSAARSRSLMGGKKAKAAGRAKAVRRAAHDVLSERHAKRRNQRQKGKAGQ